MKKTFVFISAVLFLFVLSCIKEYSGNSKQTFTDTLSLDYPYATGLCKGNSLGISIVDTVNYIPDTLLPLPSSFMLDMPVPGDQGSQGSCAAWAVVYGAGNYYMHSVVGKAYSDTGNLSPKFTYNQITKGNCLCTSLLDNLYLLKTQGACSLQEMPYDPTECAKQPDSLQEMEAEPYKINGWKKVNLHNLSSIKKAVAENHPVLFSINVSDEFSFLQTPFIWHSGVGDPSRSHGMVICGYDDTKHAFRLQNSWGIRWADGGFAWIDYDYFFHNVIEDGYIVF